MSEHPANNIYEELTNYTLSKCQIFYDEVRQLLPQLPAEMQFTLDNSRLINGYASGGGALSPREIAVAYDPFFAASTDEKEAELRATVFHEAYHVAQNFTFEIPKPSPMENAIYEGAATVFEREMAASSPRWGEYPADVSTWVEEVKALPPDYDWRKWKFYDPETDRSWILYRTGTFIVDRALARNPQLTIVNLSSQKAYTKPQSLRHFGLYKLRLCV
ncbi:MAG: hypothetical protein ACREGF_03480 [Candidatus Saccharimonadales bacterium]